MMHSLKNHACEGNTLIGQGCTLSGDVSSDGDVRIDGTLNGNIVRAQRLVVGRGGSIKGNVHCREAVVMGTINGSISVEGMFHLQNHGSVKGDIDAGSLQLDAQSVFNGYLRTGHAVAKIRVINDFASRENLLLKRGTV